MAEKIIDININPASPKLALKQDTFDNGRYVSLIPSTKSAQKMQVDIDTGQLNLLGNEIVYGLEFLELETINKIIVNAINELKSWKKVGQTGDYRTWIYKVRDNCSYRISYTWEDASTAESPVCKRLEFYVKDASSLTTVVLDQFQTIPFDMRSRQFPEILLLKVSETGIFIDVFQKGDVPTIKGNIIGLEESSYAI